VVVLARYWFEVYRQANIGIRLSTKTKNKFECGVFVPLFFVWKNWCKCSLWRGIVWGIFGEILCFFRPIQVSELPVMYRWCFFVRYKYRSYQWCIAGVFLSDTSIGATSDVSPVFFSSDTSIGATSLKLGLMLTNNPIKTSIHICSVVFQKTYECSTIIFCQFNGKARGCANGCNNGYACNNGFLHHLETCPAA